MRRFIFAALVGTMVLAGCDGVLDAIKQDPVQRDLIVQTATDLATDQLVEQFPDMTRTEIEDVIRPIVRKLVDTTLSGSQGVVDWRTALGGILGTLLTVGTVALRTYLRRRS